MIPAQTSEAIQSLSYSINELSPFTTYNVNVSAIPPDRSYRPPTRLTVTTQMAAPLPMNKPDFYGVLNGEEITVRTIQDLYHKNPQISYQNPENLLESWKFSIFMTKIIKSSSKILLKSWESQRILKNLEKFRIFTIKIIKSPWKSWKFPTILKQSWKIQDLNHKNDQNSLKNPFKFLKNPKNPQKSWKIQDLN